MNASARAVRAPLHVAQADVVAERRAVVVGRHLEAGRRAPVSTSMTTRCSIAIDLVAGQRELRDAQRRVADRVDGRVDEVHLADLALVLLVGGDLLRVGRPEHDGAVAAAPAGVVGGVAEVLHAVGRQRRSCAGGDVAHPEVPVADEDRALAVRRGRRRCPPRRVPRAAAAAACRLPRPPALAPAGGGAGVGARACPARRTTSGGRSRSNETVLPSADSSIDLERQLRARCTLPRRPPTAPRRASRDRTPAARVFVAGVTRMNS